MNVLFFIPDINQAWGGVRQYTVALLKILATDSENKYFIYHGSNDPEIMGVLKDNYKFNLLIPRNNRSNFNIYITRIKKLISLVTKKQFETPLDKVCKKFDIDIIHCPYQHLPESKFSKSICTMHDVQELHFPEYFTPETRAARAVSYMKDIKNAEKIFVSYQHVKDDIIKYFYKCPEDIAVCLLEMDKLWIDNYNSSHIKSLDPLGITGDFLLYPANTWEHKNHIALLQALVEDRNLDRVGIKFVFTGHKTSFYFDILAPYINNNGLENQVIFTGILEEDMLFSLYKKCKGVVVPTLYEAGSFPLMEALLLSVPVICSNVTSLPETIGNQRFTFDPLSLKEITIKLNLLWSDEKFRLDCLENCKNQSFRLKKTGSSEIIKTVYQACLR